MASTGRTATPTMEDIVGLLRSKFGMRYEESYEHGLREFEDVVSDHFGMSEGDARKILLEMEQAQVIQFLKAAAARDSEGPRVGLFDEPGAFPDGRPEPEITGRHWQIGRQGEEY
jgi:hypothetical protein